MQTQGGTVWIGRDNELVWQLWEDRQVLAADRALAISRVRLTLSGHGLVDPLVVDSQADPGLVGGMGTDTLRFSLGHVPGLVPARGRRLAAELVVYSPDWPAGLVWEHGIQVSVR